jgi:hypothetical protein
MTGNRRAVARRPLQITCRIVREKDMTIVPARTRDVSLRGFQVRTQTRLFTGECLIVSFREVRTGHWVDAVAHVARVVHGRRTGDEGRSYGLDIERIDPSSRRALERALRSVPPVIPRVRVQPEGAQRSLW